MVKSIKKYSIYLLISMLSFTGCSKSDGGGVNIFSLEDDKALGEQLEAEIASDPQQFPVLDPAKYPKAYEHLGRIVNTILNSGKVAHKDDFDWTFKIIHNDSTLNAFAGPGGKIYVYTGIIKYLDTETHLAGVLGHEIAHADRRHVTDQLTKIYGISLLLDVVLGKNAGTLAEIAANLAFLKFSRNHEADADKYSVIYLCPTDYGANGAAGFFQKLIDQGQAGGTPEFLSTHPDPGNRVSAINNEANSMNCGSENINNSLYQDFKNSLP